MQYKRVVDEWEVSAQLIGGIGVAPIIKNINGLGVNAQIPENAALNKLKGKEDPNEAYTNSKKQGDKFFLYSHHR